MKDEFVCPRCGNKDPLFIGTRNGKKYCRLCISYNGKQYDNNYIVSDNIRLNIDYQLSNNQQSCSDKVKEALIQKKNVLIHAVTGAGKTELVFASMEMYLKKRKRVGFASPRKDVIIDLFPRINSSFINCKTVAVYGEHTDEIDGDIVVLTTHQLYRYENAFDLLIIDEIDAFPYKNNFLLNTFAKKSVRGNYILLSATPSIEDVKAIKANNGVIVKLFERYHHGKLIVPTVKTSGKIRMFINILRLLKSYEEKKKPVFIFVPTIKQGKILFSLISIFYKNGAFVSSKEDRRKIEIDRFKNHELSFLVTTSILERGVTVRNLQVIIYDCSNPLYKKETLIQIAGRVGRKKDCTDGDVYFLCEEENEDIKEAIKEIRTYNDKKDL